MFSGPLLLPYTRILCLVSNTSVFWSGGVSCLWWLGSSLFSNFYRRILVFAEGSITRHVVSTKRELQATGLARLTEPVGLRRPSAPALQSAHVRARQCCCGTAAPRLLTGAKRSSCPLPQPPAHSHPPTSGPSTLDAVSKASPEVPCEPGWGSGVHLGNVTAWSQSTAY